MAETVTIEQVEVTMTVEGATLRDELPNERRVRPRSPTASTPEGRMSQQFSMTQEASSSSTAQPSQPPQQSCPQMLVPEPIQSGGVPHYYEQSRQSCANPPCSQPATAQVSVGRDVAMAFCHSCARVCQSFLEIELTMEQISFLNHLHAFTGQTLKDTCYEAVLADKASRADKVCRRNLRVLGCLVSISLTRVLKMVSNVLRLDLFLRSYKLPSMRSCTVVTQVLQMKRRYRQFMVVRLESIRW